MLISFSTKALYALNLSKRKECETSETTTLVNKTHKSNEKLCFYCKKPGHFVRNCLKKKMMKKKKPIKLVYWKELENKQEMKALRFMK